MPLLDYVQPKGYQAGGLPLTDVPHGAIDSLIEESDNTLLGWATGLMSKLGIMDDPIKHATDIPALSETGKITDENLRDAFKIAQGAFSLESIGGPAKAGSLISATKAPVWKKAVQQGEEVASGLKGATEMSGQSILASMKSGIQSRLEPLKQKASRIRSSRRAQKQLEIAEKEKGLPPILSTKLKDTPAKTELDDIALKLSNLESKQPTQITDADLVGSARNALDDALAGAMDEYNRFGTVSPSRSKYIRQLNDEMQRRADVYFKEKPYMASEIEKWFSPKSEPGSSMTSHIFEPWDIYRSLLGRGRMGNVRLDPDALYWSNRLKELKK